MTDRERDADAELFIELAADVEGLSHPRARVREEAYRELEGRLILDGLDADGTAWAIPQIARVLAAGGPGAASAAALLLALVDEAQSERCRVVLEAASVLDGTLDLPLDPIIREALDAARRLRDGETPIARGSADDLIERAVALDWNAQEPTEEDVIAWCEGHPSVGDVAEDVALDLLVEVALVGSQVAAVEPTARAAVRPPEPHTPAGLVLGAAHRAMFHAVLAWRLGLDDALPAGFGSHREEERALARWVFALSERDMTKARRLLALVGCESVEALREREAAHEQPDDFERSEDDFL